MIFEMHSSWYIPGRANNLVLGSQIDFTYYYSARLAYKLLHMANNEKLPLLFLPLYLLFSVSSFLSLLNGGQNRSKFRPNCI